MSIRKNLDDDAKCLCRIAAAAESVAKSFDCIEKSAARSADALEALAESVAEINTKLGRVAVSTRATVTLGTPVNQ